ncbi:hypothetical protein AVEN_80395-1 [Araneus ventricosus]|uniref:Uncharacterized protein n=1 Tax=Araneus ventricosus TaxID=182803 RepID=A0A4Y2M5W0_ARAVE|nr:hypothetical protein AVEN_80395-1 [Araneus ventricosus]
MPAVIVVFLGDSEFPLSLIEELKRSRILRSLYFNGLRNQRVTSGILERMRHQLDSANLNGHLSYYPTPCCDISLRRTDMGKNNWSLYHAYL